MSVNRAWFTDFEARDYDTKEISLKVINIIIKKSETYLSIIDYFYFIYLYTTLVLNSQS